MNNLTYFRALLLGIIFLMLCLLSSCKKNCEQPAACDLPPEAGLCHAAFVKYYYDQTEEKCKEFIWGGCGDYPFDTLVECEVCLCN